jgi:hypothetical protein
MQNLQKENSKVAFELALCKKKVAELRDNCNSSNNADDVSELSKYGVDKVKVK